MNESDPVAPTGPATPSPPGAADPAATLRPATRADLLGLPLDIAPRLLDGVLTVTVDGETVAARITEVEAYHGKGTGPVPDLGSHARMGYTRRNATMWGEPGHLYVYLSHGIHSCANVVCGPEGEAGGILLRAGEIIEGVDIARRRRPAARTDRELARGPGRFGDAMGLRHALHDGIDVVTGKPQNGAVAHLQLRIEPVTDVASGPRVGIAGHAGTDAFPWRFWIAGDRTVSPFRWGRGAAEAAAAAQSISPPG
jgi:DNA-3-methyladenine glycosylase